VVHSSTTTPWSKSRKNARRNDLHRMSENKMDIYCRVCGVKFDTWPSGTGGKAKGACKSCRDRWGFPKPVYRHCQLCGTDSSPQWRKFRTMHVCNACGVKMYRRHETDYYSDLRRDKRPTAENISWAKQMLEKLMQDDEEHGFDAEE